MAKQHMTKSQIVAHFAEKFELPKKTPSAILDEVAALAVSETKKNGSFTVPGRDWEAGLIQTESS